MNIYDLGFTKQLSRIAPEINSPLASISGLPAETDPLNPLVYNTIDDRMSSLLISNIVATSIPGLPEATNV